MALITKIPLVDVAAVAARALDELLGRDVVLTVGSVVRGDPAYDAVPADATRTVVLPFSDGIIGEVTLVFDERFATAMETVTPDVSLTTAALPALLAGAEAIALTTNVGIDPDDACEIATGNLLTGAVGDVAAVPLFENETLVACLVVRIVDEAPRAPGGVAGHEFPPLGGTDPAEVPARPLSLLNDVAMEVTAELGRRRLKVRDIVTLQPGSVLELDRAAGSPVDVLVNGAVVFRGEVVVADDDLGVRVSEVVVDDSSTPRAAW
jgi:flagellar motor switch protein FliN